MGGRLRKKPRSIHTLSQRGHIAVRNVLLKVLGKLLISCLNLCFIFYYYYCYSFNRLAPPPVCSADILFYRNKCIYLQQLTFRLSGNQQQNQKHGIEFSFVIVYRAGTLVG